MKTSKFLIILFLFLSCMFVLWERGQRSNKYSDYARAYSVVWADVGMFENALQKN